MRILVVENDPRTQSTLQSILANAGHVFCAALGEEAIDLAKRYAYDMMTLELNLPDMSGHEVLRNLRRSHIDTPILILSAADDTENKIKAFGFGADAFVSKPFHREILIAEIHAIIRRANGHSESLIVTGKISVNIRSKIVTVGKNRVHLTSNEYRMLELMSLRKGSCVSNSTFITHLYGEEDAPDAHLVDAFICKLRKKLSEATDGDNYIQTVWGAGYRLEDPSAAVDAP